MGHDLTDAEITLRPAAHADLQRLWSWRNDPDTRDASLTTTIIPLEEHARWFEDQLRSPEVALFIIEHVTEHVPCGQIRLNRLQGKGALVSIGLASEWRGRGIGSAALRAVQRPRARPAWASPLYAVIRRDNVRSQRAFEAAGFVGPSDEAVALLGPLESGTGVWVFQPDIAR